MPVVLRATNSSITYNLVYIYSSTRSAFHHLQLGIVLKSAESQHYNSEMEKKTLCFTSVLVVVAVCLLAGSALADMDADNKACTNQLESLSTCISYVQGTDKSPKADCCTNLKTVRETTPKCLCVLVKDSSSPSLGVSINQTLALGLPSACKVNAEISKCPALLNLSPNSPDAKIFEAANSSSPATPSSGGSSPSTTSPSTATKDSGKSLKAQLSLSALAVLLPLGFSILSKF